MLFDEMALRTYCLHLGVKKTCYPGPVKINRMLNSINQMESARNNKLKQLLIICAKQHLKVFNGTNY